MPAINLDAAGFARATPQQAWAVLTDYEALPSFVPGLVHSHVLRRAAQEVVVEQESRAGFLFFSQSVRLTLSVAEHPYAAIDVALVEGDLRHFDAHWELSEAVEHGVHGTRIRYRGKLTPPLMLPPLIGNALVQANVRQTVDATVAEIERRSRH